MGENDDGWNKFVALVYAIGLSEVGRKTGVTHTAVRKWLVRGRVPADRVMDAAKATGANPRWLNAEIDRIIVEIGNRT